MRSSASAVILFAVCSLASCALGVAIGRWTASKERELRPPAPTVSFDFASLLAETEKLSAKPTAAEAERLDPPPEDAARDDARLPRDDARLIAAIDRLNESLATREEPARAAPREAIANVGNGYRDLDAIWSSAIAVAPEDPPVPVPLVELSREHVGWSRERLIDRYGAPTRVRADERGLLYLYGREVAPSRFAAIRFLVSDGLVIAVELD